MTLPTTIPAPLARALEKKGYESLTEVQTAVLADGLSDADLLVSAQTGSGKTAAFGMAIASTILGEGDSFDFAAAPLALVVAPTRELALQVQRELEWLYGEAYGRIASCVGGMDPRTERRALQRGCHVVVGTPGRLRDHIERGALDMSALRAVVLDEADEMLDFGFREDLEFILDSAPADRRTLLFSATVPKEIADIARRFQRDAVRIKTVSEREQHVDIAYRVLSVAPSDRENAIINTLRFYDAARAIVFCRTREEVNRLASRFGNRGFQAVALSGELSQNERTHALQAIRDGRARVCIATDVAARGIDLPGLELVIHADLPTNAETLLHRSGRTGRAGQKGVCALIVPYSRKGRANRLLRDARIQAEWAEAPDAEAVEAKDRERLFNDPVLSETYEEDALEDARALIEKFGAEQIAAAFMARRRAAMPAAEELIASGPREDKPREPRENFKDGVWFKLTAGRKERAEPRWLLPLICRLGHVTKREVGSIRIGEAETRFEIAANKAEAFMASVVENGGGEKSIRILPVEPGEGDDFVEAAPAPFEGRRPDRKPRKFDKPRFDKPRDDKGKYGKASFDGDRPKKAFKAKPRRDDALDEAPAFDQDDATPRPKKAFKGKPKGDAPKRKFSKKPKPGKAPGGSDYPVRRKDKPAGEGKGAALKRVKRKPKPGKAG